MATNTYHELAKKDSPIFGTGPIVSFPPRFDKASVESRKHAAETAPKDQKKKANKRSKDQTK